MSLLLLFQKNWLSSCQTNTLIAVELSNPCEQCGELDYTGQIDTLNSATEITEEEERSLINLRNVVNRKINQCQRVN